MKFPPNIKVYGDQSCRDSLQSCEDVEHINFVSWLQLHHPQHHAVLVHPKNEGKRTFGQIAKEKKMGLTKGASDILIMGSPAFVCEIKKINHVKCKWETGQKEFLAQSQNNGAFACVALGSAGAKEAFKDWLKLLTAR